MPRTHRTREGSWAVCAKGESCKLPFHVELSVAEAEALPERVFEALAEAIDPPTYHLPNGTKSWQDKHGKPHRRYDLPAIIYSNGAREWYTHGTMQRGRDRATRVEADGFREWWQHGHLVRTQLPDKETMDWV